MKTNLKEYLTLPLTCVFDEERPNKWKSILNGEETTIQGLEHNTFWTTYSDTILNHQFNQKLKLMGKGKFNRISNNVLSEGCS